MVVQQSRAPLTREDVESVVGRVQFTKDFRVGENADGFYIQIEYLEDDAITGAADKPQRGRKWLVSRWATKSEIVQTCLTAALASAEHQVREAFKYAPDDESTPRAIFGPHFDSDVLYSICGKRQNYDARPDPA